MKKIVLIAGILLLNTLTAFSPAKEQRLKNEEMNQYRYKQILAQLQEQQRVERLKKYEHLLTVYNNNPFNIRNSGNNWQGRVDSQESFERFQTLDYGIRAGFKLLHNYQKNYGLETVEQIVYRFAPPHENDTEGYINWICKWTGFGRTTPIDLRKKDILISFSKYIIEMETGKPIDKRKLEKVYNKYFT